MSFTDKLDALMAEKGINKSVLSKESGIPYTTIAGFYTKGTDNVKLSTLKSFPLISDALLIIWQTMNTMSQLPLQLTSW